MTVRSILISTCVMGLLLSGCDDKGSTPAQTGTTAPSAQSGTASKSDSVEKSQKKIRETEKWNSYVALSNTGPLHYEVALKEYVETHVTNGKLDLEKKNPMAGTYFAPRTPSSLNDLTKSATEIAKQEPKWEIDATVVPFCEALLNLTSLLEQAKAYYRSKDYVDDSYARGKELHPKIMAAVETVYKAQDAFEQGMAAMDVQKLLESLQSMRAAGLKIRPAAIDMIQILRESIVEINRVTADGTKPGALTLAEYQPIYDKLVVVYKELEAVISDEALAKQENINMSTLRTLGTSAKNIKRQASSVMEGLQKKIPYTPSSTKDFGGSLSRMVDTYNDLK